MGKNRENPHWEAKVCPNTGKEFKIIDYPENTIGHFGPMSGREGVVFKCSSCEEEISFVGWIS